MNNCIPINRKPDGTLPTLSEHLIATGISLFASLAADVPPIRMPRLLARIPDARAAVFAAIPYYVEGETSNLAMFARCRDYHAFAVALGESCAALLSARYPGCAAGGFADHSPYAEVRGAAMAGLGVIGDHGLLITRPYSSFVFVFSLVTSLTQSELEKEGIPLGSGEIRECRHCGACTAACPGGCRGADRTRCLSAITQKKGELTAEEIDLLRNGAFAWGCDVCQLVCPCTLEARKAGHMETTIPFFLSPRITRLDERTLDAMSEEEYASFAFGWRKKEVMRRNLRLRGEDAP